MSMTIDPRYKEFVQTVIDNIKKNGFPDKKVAFPIEKLYDAADKKDLNFDKVLEILDEFQIVHVKTPKKIIFYAKNSEPMVEVSPETKDAPHPMDTFVNMDQSVLQGMDPSEMMATAAQMMQNMNPEQLESAKKMYENMSDEDRAQLMEQAKKMGFF
ncbi:MAG: hypothetical protein GY847_07000 [Proteobacteria bacterium]|nr:hypothetical protein [Pseudomonadota bacterium]